MTLWIGRVHTIMSSEILDSKYVLLKKDRAWMFVKKFQSPNSGHIEANFCEIRLPDFVQPHQSESDSIFHYPNILYNRKLRFLVDVLGTILI